MHGKPTGVVYVVKSNLMLEEIIDLPKRENPFPSSMQLTKIETVAFQAHWIEAIRQNLMQNLPPSIVQMHCSSNDITLIQLLGEYTWFLQNRDLRAMSHF